LGARKKKGGGGDRGVTRVLTKKVPPFKGRAWGLKVKMLCSGITNA